MFRQLYSVMLYALLLGASVVSHSYPLKQIVTNGHSNYVVVVRDNAARAEITAAEELKEYIKRISGAQLKIISETNYTSGPMIAVGFNSKLQRPLSEDSFGKLADEEILIQPYKDTLLLAGGSPRGTLYAVYEFLDKLGVRFYSPKFTKIPKNNDVLMPKACRYIPLIRARSMTVGNAGDTQWCARNRLNSISLWSSPGEKYGDGYAEGPDMHTFWRQMPEEMLYKHPDWAAEVDGKRLLPAGNRNWGALPEA